MVDLDQFKANAKERGICGLLADWDNCKSKKQLVDLALSAPAIDFVARAIAEGWGPSADCIAKEFEPFVNGKYVRRQDGYTSALYCNSEGEISITTACALIVGHKGLIRVEIPICELYIANSDCEIVGGIANIYAYNSEVKRI